MDIILTCVENTTKKIYSRRCVGKDLNECKDEFVRIMSNEIGSYVGDFNSTYKMLRYDYPHVN